MIFVIIYLYITYYLHSPVLIEEEAMPWMCVVETLAIRGQTIRDNTARQNRMIENNKDNKHSENSQDNRIIENNKKRRIIENSHQQGRLIIIVSTRRNSSKAIHRKERGQMLMAKE